MEVFFYCNYSNSKRGFLLTKLYSHGLDTVSLFNSQDKGEQIVDRFFSYDCFRILWMDISKNEAVFFKPETEKSFFGIRGFTGTISDRKGYLNIAFLAENDEKEVLDALARGILYDTNGFSKKVFDALSVGGKNGYELDTAKFEAVIDSAVNTEFENFPVNIKPVCNTSRDLLKLGVFIGSWEDACTKLGPDLVWKIKPRQAINEDTYHKLFNQ